MEEQFKSMINNQLLNSDVIKAYIAERVKDEIGKKKLESVDKLMSTREVCNYLNICEKTLFKYRKCGVIQYSKIGRKISYKMSEIEKFITNSKPF